MPKEKRKRGGSEVCVNLKENGTLIELHCYYRCLLLTDKNNNSRETCVKKRLKFFLNNGAVVNPLASKIAFII